MKRVLCALLGALLLLSVSACKAADEPVEGLSLYTLTAASARPGGDIVTAAIVPWDDLPDERQAQAEAVMVRLLQSENSPLPKGTVLNEVSLSGSTAYVDLGGTYGHMQGVDMTIADYCITLSLTQLTGVYAVRILADGQEVQQRSKQVFLAGDALLSSMDDVVRTLTVQLLFPDETGAMVVEERLLEQYEGESTPQVVLDALLGGPESDELLPLLPEGFIGMTARMEAGVCHLNIPAESLARLSLSSRETTLQAIVDSLLSVEGLRTVELYVDGEPQGEIR